MEAITTEELEEVLEEEEEEEEVYEITDQDFNKLLEKMQNPVEAQKELAVQVKDFLDKRIKSEMTKSGILSDHTRRWVEAYNNILEKLQKSLYGDKSVNLHVHKVTHSEIANRMRKARSYD